ncbi:MAG: DUF805 domain-containing protein [Muribaculaceae bacterium]|nr:DUF805 domain-containing protein [Muribaculaceae bacterium]
MAIREIPAMPFLESVKQTLTQNYCNFNGRARRSEFWYFALFTTIIGMLMSIIINFGSIGIIISLVVNLALLLPSFGVAFRRLHDINKSGWYIGALYILLAVFLGLDGLYLSTDSNIYLILMCVILILLIIYGIIMLVWYCKDSDPLPNQYGPSPKYIDVE